MNLHSNQLVVLDSWVEDWNDPYMGCLKNGYYPKEQFKEREHDDTRSWDYEIFGWVPYDFIRQIHILKNASQNSLVFPDFESVMQHLEESRSFEEEPEIYVWALLNSTNSRGGILPSGNSTLTMEHQHV